ncbi:MAG TPA: hypothetical protein VFG76_03695, partial [Candidatus Polarisedimenticolia bacterium]|nr:hypothetical protein [Candidatus Polarisedimenticolia bacterium]
EMKAVSALVPWSDLAPRALAAGCDMLLVCRSRDAIRASLDAMKTWMGDGRLPLTRVDQALLRVAALRARAGARVEASLASFQHARDELGRCVTALG